MLSYLAIVEAASTQELAAPDAISLLWSIPFALLLLCAATIPLVNKHWWEKHFLKISFGLGAVIAAYYLFIAASAHPWAHGMEEYVSFIALLGSLYIVSGGIFIRVSQRATPGVNVVILLIGALASNVFGTTGAAMLLIRPFMRLNRAHLKPYHIVFFIFIVANVGGSLTPIGDPPLFLGYLRGVPFWWVLEYCRQMWIATVGALLVIFYVVDWIDYRKVARAHVTELGPTVSISGWHNFLFIGLILAGVFRPGMFDILHGKLPGAGWMSYLGCREFFMLLAVVGSKFFTHREIYQRNEFNYHAIKEVAILFVGIFSTMAPALQWLETNASRMPLHTPGQYYFSCGTLSAVLDNAPTYLTFLKAELSQLDNREVQQAMDEVARMETSGVLRIRDDLESQRVYNALLSLVKYHHADIVAQRVTREEVEISFLIGNEDTNALLIAVSLGAVFFGASTYIGNGPNFMVKAIAEADGVIMPGFFGYVVKYSVPILLPVLVGVWWLFLRV